MWHALEVFLKCIHTATSLESIAMLDLNHPMTQHVFRAAALIGSAMALGQRMSIPERPHAELLAECLPVLGAMRELARAHFSEQAEYICRAVDELEQSLRRLAALGEWWDAGGRNDEKGECTNCRTPIKKVHLPAQYRGFEHHFVIICPRCDELFMQAMEKLESSEGFGTWAI
jgi:hypothetical protein